MDLGLNDSNQLGYETENGMSLEPKKVTLGANNEQAVLIAAGDKYNLAIGMSSKVTRGVIITMVSLVTVMMTDRLPVLTQLNTKTVQM